MRLRTQLALFFAVMTGIVLALGTLTVWGGIRIVDAFSVTMADMEKLSQVRNLQNLLTRQKASLTIFLLNRDVKELQRFDILSRIILIRVKEIEFSAPADEPRLYDDLKSRYGDIISIVTEALR